MAQELTEKLERIKLLEEKARLQRGLPHLYGWPFYKWARKFFESTNDTNLLCAANQISKSSTQIRKCIHWATAIHLWPKLWKTRPLQFWYLYPTKDVATIEFEKKWKTEFLPREEYKDHPVYGWREEYKNKQIFALHFNTNVSVYFKTYAQDIQHLQSGTCHAIFCDEELPEDLFDELNFRLSATNGHFHMVFTATLGQEFWREAIEDIGKPGERFPDALKLQISMNDCLEYEDGSPTPWTPARIAKRRAMCRTKAQEKRRVDGRFVVDEGRKYPGFERSRNMKAPVPVPPDWHIYAGVDIGSGESRHPAAICFVAVKPDFSRGRVIRGWRGDNVETTAEDIYRQYQEMRGHMRPVMQCYDTSSRDFFTITSRLGDPFVPAEKAHDIGEQTINTLFKSEMLVIDDIEELRPLAKELESLLASTAKRKARDDFIDAMRYAITRTPWDWSLIEKMISVNPQLPKSAAEELSAARIAARQPVEDQAQMFIDDEIDSWNELYDAD